jgi:hypothetical protein
MPLEQILIVAKTYPTPSTKHDETVCTAGLRKNGSWIRIYGKKTSLAVFKPTSISDLKCVPAKEHDWNKNTIASIKARALQVDLFMGAENPFEVVQKVPYEFSYEFLDDEGVSSTLQIIDWEIGALYWNCLKSSDGNEKTACEKVRLKYWDDFVLKKDTYFILGTTLKFHSRKSRNPFLIIGVFPPKHDLQQRMDLFVP